MSRSLLRGLRILEALSDREPMAVGDIADQLALDKSVVSRMVAACEADGWVVRIGRKAALGPRAALLGQGDWERALIQRAEVLVHALAGVTGLSADAYQLAGSKGFPLASAAGRNTHSTLSGSIGPAFPLWATASGKALAALLDHEQLDRLLPPDPLPAFTPTTCRSREEFLEAVRGIQAGEIAYDGGEYVPGFACLAIPWPLHRRSPLALAVVANSSELPTVRTRAERALRAAVEEGATADAIVAAGVSRSSDPS